ncbi:MAG: DUF3108 domain-containing protein [Gammaproteobacteria bacterium]|nr:DUF3108 domain-containing protein [Gammaproteobacteria bacterium]
MKARGILLGWILLAMAAPCTGAAAGAQQLLPFSARYSFAWRGMTVGESTLRLERDAGDRWKYTASTSPRGFARLLRSRPVVNETLMQQTASGLRPLHYRAEDGSDSTERDLTLDFDWEHGRVTGQAGERSIDMNVPEGTQDDLSVQVALMYQLLAGRIPESFRVFDERGVREYRYIHEGSATLATPFGQVTTEVYRSQRDGSPRATRFWCAPGYGYLPMRVEQRRKGAVEWTMEIRHLDR